MTGRLLAVRLADLHHRIAVLPGPQHDYVATYLRLRADASRWVRAQEAIRCWDLDRVDRLRFDNALARAQGSRP